MQVKQLSARCGRQQQKQGEGSTRQGRKRKDREQHGEEQESEQERRQQSTKEGDHGKHTQ